MSRWENIRVPCWGNSQWVFFLRSEARSEVSLLCDSPISLLVVDVECKSRFITQPTPHETERPAERPQHLYNSNCIRRTSSLAFRGPVNRSLDTQACRGPPTWKFRLLYQSRTNIPQINSVFDSFGRGEGDGRPEWSEWYSSCYRDYRPNSDHQRFSDQCFNPTHSI